MATTEQNIKQIVFNKLSSAKYEELKAAGQLNANEFYITPDESVTQDELTNALEAKADKADVYTKDEVDAALEAKDSLPSQENNAGKFLSTNGTDASWEDLPTASTTDAGIVKLASAEEITAGTSTTSVVSVKDLNTAIDAKADKETTYTKTEVDAIVASAFHYKGSKATIDDLPTEDNKIGDVWNVEATGANYAWTGTEWDKLSETLDLTVFYTKDEVDGLLDDKQDTLTFDNAPTEDSENVVKSGGVFTALVDKADKSDTYTKTEVDDLIEPLAVKDDVDTALEAKADADSVYTKDEVDEAIENKIVAVIRTWDDE